MPGKNEAPLIGEDFSGPVENGPREAPLQRKDTPPEELEEALGIGSDKSALEETKPLTPEDKAKQYRKGLEELEIPIEKAREVLDEVIFNRAYTADIVIGGKLRVGLRTRVYNDTQRVLLSLEAEVPTFPVHTDDLIARYNVAASLAYYSDDKFDFPDVRTAKTTEIEEAFHKRMRYLTSLPEVIINRLIAATGKFDQEMAAIFADGAPEDF